MLQKQNEYSAIDLVKVKKVGNSLAVGLKKDSNLKVGEEFFMYRDDRGVITLIPKIPDYYKNVTEGQFVDSEDPDNLAKNVGIKDEELNIK